MQRLRSAACPACQPCPSSAPRPSGGRCSTLAAEADRRGLRRPRQPRHPRQPRAVRIARPRHVADPVLDEHPADLPQPPGEVAITAAHLAEVSGGRFRLGLGVSHEPAMQRLGHLDRQAAGGHARVRRAASGRPSARPARCRRSSWPRCATRCSTSRSRSPTGRSGPTPRSRTCRRRSPLPAERRDAFALANMAADGDRRRQGRGAGDPPPHAHRLRDAAELPQLLEAGRLRGGDGGHRGRHRGRRPRDAARR